MNVRIAVARLLESGALAVSKPALAEKAVMKSVRIPRDLPSPAGFMRWMSGSLLSVGLKAAAAAILVGGIVLGLTLRDRGFAISVPAEEVPTSSAFVRGLEPAPSGGASTSMDRFGRHIEPAVTNAVEGDARSYRLRSVGGQPEEWPRQGVPGGRVRGRR